MIYPDTQLTQDFAKRNLILSWNFVHIRILNHGKKRKQERRLCFHKKLEQPEQPESKGKPMNNWSNE